MSNRGVDCCFSWDPQAEVLALSHAPEHADLHAAAAQWAGKGVMLHSRSIEQLQCWVMLIRCRSVRHARGSSQSAPGDRGGWTSCPAGPHVLLHELHNAVGVLEVAHDDHRHVLWAVPPLVESLHCGSWDVANDALLPDGQPLRILHRNDTNSQASRTMRTGGNCEISHVSTVALRCGSHKSAENPCFRKPDVSTNMRLKLCGAIAQHDMQALSRTGLPCNINFHCASC